MVSLVFPRIVPKINFINLWRCHKIYWSMGGSRFTLGCGGRAVFTGRYVYVRNRSQPSATVRNRPQPFASVRNRSREGRMAVPVVSSAKGVVTFGGFQCRVASFRVAAWHFVTFQHASKHVKSRFVWQVQYFRYIFRRCVAFFVAGAALWRPPMSFCVAGGAYETCRVARFLRIALSALCEVVQS